MAHSLLHVHQHRAVLSHVRTGGTQSRVAKNGGRVAEQIRLRGIDDLHFGRPYATLNLQTKFQFRATFLSEFSILIIRFLK